MEKRALILGEYNTAVPGWTLAACHITKAVQVQTFVPIPGRPAPLDLSTELTDGQPYYDSAYLDATLELSEGDRPARQALIEELVNYADGRSLHIVHPDHPDHYLIGRVQVNAQYSDLAHCAVDIHAVCDPWLYAAMETEVILTAEETEKPADLLLTGRLAAVPTITVTGEAKLTFNGNTWTLSAGEHILPDLYLTPGTSPGVPGRHTITYSGTGTIKLKWREAVLAA